MNLLSNATITEDQFIRQLRLLGMSKPARTTVTYWLQRGYIEPRIGGVGGRGERRRIPASAACQVFAHLSLYYQYGTIPNVILRARRCIQIETGELDFTHEQDVVVRALAEKWMQLFRDARHKLLKHDNIRIAV